MRGYTDQEVAAIAGFFAEQPWVSTDRTTDVALAHRGQEIHDVQCETCHGDGGREQEDESPRLAGQWSHYTRYALENCRAEGKRCDPRKMGERVLKLSDEELEALAQYYESQK
jgi:sulfide dehydrogenase cytochrome subunit